MTKAEEKANKRWPIHPWTILPKEGEHGEIINFDEWLDDYRIWVQSFSANRGYKEGYEQAEKDLGWISVFDRLPAPSEWVVVCIEHYGRAQCLALATYNHETKEWHTADFEDGEEETVYVEYWMPIPNIIKEEKK